jgi:1-acyl-sn-glycerol-3-phosphate acyltransferase
LGWILLIVPIQFLLILVKSNLRFFLPLIFHKFLLKILGIRLSIKGRPSDRKPLILIGNHCSYLDIIILGSVLPVCFVAKSEIKGWFLFGTLASLQNSIFIDRRNFKALDSLKKISKNLSSNFAIIIFPEGTTNNGKRVLKFRASLFKVFEDDPTLGLQNFSLCYTHINSMPLDNRMRPNIAWYGEMNLITHLKRLLNYSSIGAKLQFHPSIVPHGVTRKIISEESREQVIKGINSLSNN